MDQVKVKFTSKIVQQAETETFTFQTQGQMQQTGVVTRFSYQEQDQTPVKMVLRDKHLLLARGDKGTFYSTMQFVPGELAPCKLLIQGRQMDLQSSTDLLELRRLPDCWQLNLRYDLFSGQELIANYAICVDFYPVA